MKNGLKNFVQATPLNQGGPTTYNAWEEDIATLNVFFGQDTVMGENFKAKINLHLFSS